MSSVLSLKEYVYYWPCDSSRWAKIVFGLTDVQKNIHEYNRAGSISERKWSFIRCDFFGVKKVYDIDDWTFIGEVAAEIKRLCSIEREPYGTQA